MGSRPCGRWKLLEGPQAECSDLGLTGHLSCREGIRAYVDGAPMWSHPRGRNKWFLHPVLSTVAWTTLQVNLGTIWTPELMSRLCLPGQ